MRPWTREEAVTEAVLRFGKDARITESFGTYRYIVSDGKGLHGFGHSWEEAFKDAASKAPQTA